MGELAKEEKEEKKAREGVGPDVICIQSRNQQTASAWPMETAPLRNGQHRAWASPAASQEPCLPACAATVAAEGGKQAIALERANGGISTAMACPMSSITQRGLPRSGRGDGPPGQSGDAARWR